MSQINSSFRADLHVHSYFSDGADSPEGILAHAKEMGLQGIAITDHDTVEGYKVAIPAAKQMDFPLLSGIEFSANHKQEPVHILGYSFSLNHDAVLSFCQRHQQRRKERNLKMLEKLKKLGIAIEEEELGSVQEDGACLKKRTIGRPHIALVLMKKGIVKSIREAFQKYLGEGKPAYDPGQRVTPFETIKVIHEARGFAVIAHPHLLVRNNNIKDLLSMPFDGIEGYYAQIAKEQEAKWVNIGRSKKWIITGGSDYHGAVKPHNPLGASWVDKNTFTLLYDRFLSNN